MTKVSIIIPSRDRPASLVRAIDSIRATQGDHEVEIIVVLDEPDVASQEAMQQRSDVQMIVSGPGDAYLGKPQAKNNLGYAAATGEWFVTGTDDITFDSQGWIDECLRVNLGGVVGHDEMVAGLAECGAVLGYQEIELEPGMTVRYVVVKGA